MRFEYKYSNLWMYADNDHEYDIMYRIYEDIFGRDDNDYEYFHKNGFIIVLSNETELIKIIEKMKDDKVERLLQLRNEYYTVRLAARVMLEFWR